MRTNLGTLNAAASRMTSGATANGSGVYVAGGSGGLSPLDELRLAIASYATAAAVTLDQFAEMLKQMNDDLRAHGGSPDEVGESARRERRDSGVMSPVAATLVRGEPAGRRAPQQRRRSREREMALNLPEVRDVVLALLRNRPNQGVPSRVIAQHIHATLKSQGINAVSFAHVRRAMTKIMVPLVRENSHVVAQGSNYLRRYTYCA